MGSMEHFAKRLERAYTILSSYEFLIEARMRAGKFSRKSKLGFMQMCLLILRGSKRSLQAAIYTFLRESKLELEAYSKQAFSKRRQEINPEAFLTLFRSTMEDFYTDPSLTPKTFQGMNVFAIDGTAYNLPNTPELKEIYGVQTTLGEPQTQAKGSCLYDVLNNLLIDVKMLPIKTSEREIAAEHLNYLHGLKPEHNLVLLDRGYPSMELIRQFDEQQIFYLMRCNKREFIREIREVTETDKVLDLKKQLRKTKEEMHTVMRVVQFPLENGTVETLITNLLDSSFTVEDLKYLYHLRWGVEGKYDELKNKLKIEAFSGTTPVAVLQDFYATMFLTNLVAFAEMDCEAELESINHSRERKYEYRINTTQAIASVKDSLIKLVMERNPRKLKRQLVRLSKRLIASTVPIRPGRSFERLRKHKAFSFPPNRTDV
jgi:hypothetical protein